MKSRLLIMPAVLLVLFVVGVGVGGCALNGGSGDSSATARGALYRLLDDTESSLGGRWENQDDPTPRGCVIRLWKEGELYPALRVGPAPDHAERAVSSTVELWQERGRETSRTDIGDVIEVKGTSDEGEIVILRVSDEAMTLQGESECRPVQ